PNDRGGVSLTPPPPSSGSGGEGGTGGEGGFDDGCSEQPCKLVPPQCGCRVGQRCVDTGGKHCVDVGGKPAGAVCEGDCIAGHVCADNGTGAPPMCHRYCLADTDCVGDGSRCILPLASGVEESLCTM